VAFLLGGKID